MRLIIKTRSVLVVEVLILVLKQIVLEALGFVVTNVIGRWERLYA